MLSAALRSPGCLGGGLVGSESDDKRWQIECRFLDEESLVSWERSDSYNRWGRYMQRFAAKIEIRREFGSTSLGQATEAAMAPVGDSFAPARRSSQKSSLTSSPTRTRRGVVGVVVGVVVVFGGVLAINRMALPFLSNISPLVRILVLAVVVTGVVIWVVPPMLNRMGDSAEAAPRIGAPRTRRSAVAKQKAAKAEERAREKEAAAGGRRRLDAKASDTMETLEPVGKPVERNRRRRAESELVAEPELIREPEPELVTDRVSVPVGPPTERARPVGPATERGRRRRTEPVAEPVADRVSVPVGPPVGRPQVGRTPVGPQPGPPVAGPPPRRTPGPTPPPPRREQQDRPVVPLKPPSGGFFPTSPHRIPTRER